MPSYIPETKIIIKKETAVTNTFSQVLIPAPTRFFMARLKSIIFLIRQDYRIDKMILCESCFYFRKVTFLPKYPFAFITFILANFFHNYLIFKGYPSLRKFETFAKNYHLVIPSTSISSSFTIFPSSK